MKLPNNFPKKLENATLLFVTRPKCPSSIFDVKKREIIKIEYYAIAQYENGSGINLFSIDNCFNVIGDSTFSTIERALSELEPDNISIKDWKKIS